MAIGGTMYQPQTGGEGTVGERYRATAADFYGGFGIDPTTGQLAADYRYDPMEIDVGQLQQAQAFDFSPMRQQAMGGVREAATSGLQTALTGQAAAGGLTAADRMAMASAFNRQRMGGTADVLGRFGIAEAENIWETERANQEMMNQAYLANLEEQRQAQAANIAMLMGQQEKAGTIAQQMFQADAAKRAGEALAGGYDPYSQPAATPSPSPAATGYTPSTAPSRLQARETRPKLRREVAAASVV